MFIKELAYVGVSNEDSHVRTRLPTPLAELSTQPQRLTKRQLLTLPHQMDAKDSWTDHDLTTTYLSWLPSNSIP
jgi:hypothetical protein